jgi:hypothetical protein
MNGVTRGGIRPIRGGRSLCPLNENMIVRERQEDLLRQLG